MSKHGIRRELKGCAALLALWAVSASWGPVQGQTSPAAATAAASAPARAGGRASSQGEGPSARLSATVYEVHMAADQIGRLDADALSTADKAAFDKALQALGAA